MVAPLAPAQAAAGHPGTVVTNGTALRAHSGPATSSGVTATLSNGTRILISCQTDGTRVSGTFGTSTLWDRATATDGRALGYVSDAYVRTGSDGRIAPDCTKAEPASRKPPKQLSVSGRGLTFIEQREGFRGHPYNDATDNCTIGFGHLLHKGVCTSADFKRWGTITVARGRELMRPDIEAVTSALRRELASTPLHQHEFDALASFVYNIGVGRHAWGEGFLGSAVYDDLIASPPRYSAVPEHFLTWTNGGLLRNRRILEGNLFRSGTYS
ncbi:lysozyme [Kineococcus sp. SYSU DK003]|uniref:lysozyme n=1 Tax=Kineococcus sp. SYSU DK003 TaxID=3383124 RepID=UPI003D7D972B